MNELVSALMLFEKISIVIMPFSFVQMSVKQEQIHQQDGSKSCLQRTLPLKMACASCFSIVSVAHFCPVSSNSLLHRQRNVSG